MSQTTLRLIRMILSSIVAGIIGASGVLLQSVQADGMIKPGAWVIAGITGMALMAKDINSSLATPPSAAESGPRGTA